MPGVGWNKLFRMPQEDQVTELLQRWHAGDEAALEALLREHIPWVTRRVQARLGARLRTKVQSQDLVQEVLIEFMRYGPRFLVPNQGQLRALLARIVENVIRGQHDWFAAQRRSIQRERPLPQDSVLVLDPAREQVTRPSEQVGRDESRACVRLALELVEPGEREIILARHWERASFREIGAGLGISEDAARMRFHRALLRLTAAVRRIRQGALEELLGPEPEEGWAS